MNNELTKQEMNKQRARLFNQAEHILREVYRDDFDAIYKKLCEDAGIPYAPKERELIKYKYQTLIENHNKTKGNN
jgi:hypothetical protein